jgi:hypothetical protein
MSNSPGNGYERLLSNYAAQTGYNYDELLADFESESPKNQKAFLMQIGGEAQPQQGGEQEQVMQIIQAFAQAFEQDPQAIIQQFQQASPEEQQQMLQQMVQALQQAEQEMQEAQYGGTMFMPVEDEAMELFNNAYAPDYSRFLKKQQGGEQDQIMQLIQAFSQLSGQDPQSIIEQIQQASPEEQEQMLQQMMQSVQQSQQGMQQMKNGGYDERSMLGYSDYSPYRFNESNKINSNKITMSETGIPLIGVSDTGDMQYMEPYSGEYVFDGDTVTEYPIAQTGKKQIKKKASASILKKALKTPTKIPASVEIPNVMRNNAGQLLSEVPFPQAELPLNVPQASNPLKGTGKALKDVTSNALKNVGSTLKDLSDDALKALSNGSKTILDKLKKLKVSAPNTPVPDLPKVVTGLNRQTLRNLVQVKNVAKSVGKKLPFAGAALTAFDIGKDMLNFNDPNYILTDRGLMSKADFNDEQAQFNKKQVPVPKVDLSPLEGVSNWTSFDPFRIKTTGTIPAPKTSPGQTSGKKDSSKQPDSPKFIQFAPTFDEMIDPARGFTQEPPEGKKFIPGKLDLSKVLEMEKPLYDGEPRNIGRVVGVPQQANALKNKKFKFDFNNPMESFANNMAISQAFSPAALPYMSQSRIKAAQTPLVDVDKYIQEINNVFDPVKANINTDSNVGRAYLANIAGQQANKVTEVFNNVANMNNEITARNNASLVDAANREYAANNAARATYYDQFLRTQANRQAGIQSGLNQFAQSLARKQAMNNSLNSTLMNTPFLEDETSDMDKLMNRRTIGLDPIEWQRTQVDKDTKENEGKLIEGENSSIYKIVNGKAVLQKNAQTGLNRFLKNKLYV